MERRRGDVSEAAEKQTQALALLPDAASCSSPFQMDESEPFQRAQLRPAIATQVFNMGKF